MKPLLVLLLVLAGLAALFFAFRSGSKDQGTGVAVPTNTAAEPVKSTSGAKIETPTQTEEAIRTVTSAPDVDGQPVDAAPADRATLLVGSVLDDQARPVANATVKISENAFMGEELASEFFMGIDKPKGKAISTTTDTAGQYRFKNLEPRRNYYILATHPDFSPTQESNVGVREEGESRAPDAILRQGSVLTGMVVDDNGSAVPGADLHLDSAYVLTGDPKSPDRMSTKSDNTGHFEFKNVAGGPRNLTVSAPGFGTMIVSNVLFKGSSDDTQDKEVRLSPGFPLGGRVLVQGTNQPLKGAKVVAMTFNATSSSRGEAVAGDDGSFLVENLQQGSYMLQVELDCYSQLRMNRVQVGDMNIPVEMRPRTAVSGRVIDGAGNPVRSFTVSPKRAGDGADAASFLENLGLDESFDNADGTFTVCNFDKGTFVVAIEAPGYATALSEKFTVVENQATINLTIRVSQGGTIRGKLVDPTGNPIKGAVVGSFDAGLDDINDPLFGNLISSGATRRKVRTDRDGNFELKMLAPTDYQLEITHPSYTRTLVPSLRVIEGQVVNAGSITMKGGGKVSGKVFDQAGQPVVRGSVHLAITDGTIVTFDARTDGEGRYFIDHVPAGNYQISASRSNAGAADPFQAIAEQQASTKQFNVIEGQEVTMDLTLGH
ncbi:MAG: carboxypeptidase regulatory-like domain-containing protein [Planctomycetes bacterium]|nr:carboxypeptidase regulatory-like domain-containing protein [Planctomycetota bacterium]